MEAEDTTLGAGVGGEGPEGPGTALLLPGGMRPWPRSSQGAVLLSPESGSQLVSPILVMPPPGPLSSVKLQPQGAGVQRGAPLPRVWTPRRHECSLNGTPFPAGRVVFCPGPAKPESDQMAFPIPLL